MGHVIFRGREPFDLIAQRLPSAIAENGIVVATLPIFASGFPGNSIQVRVLLKPQQAKTWQGSFCLRLNRRERTLPSAPDSLGDAARHGRRVGFAPTGKRRLVTAHTS